MPVSVVSEGRPPFIGMRYALPSPDGRWTIRLDECVEVAMGGPWRARAVLVGDGDEHPLGQHRVPAGDFWPWISENRLVWLDRRGSPIITDLDGRRLSRLDLRKRIPRWSPSSLIGHQAAQRIVAAASGRVQVCDARGKALWDLAHKNVTPGGFGAAGRVVCVARQALPYSEAYLTMHDSSTGDLTEEVRVREIHDLFATALDTKFEHRSSIDPAGATSHGGWWHGRLMVRYEPLTETTFLGFSMPTGETIEAFGKPHSVALDRWVEIAVTF